MESNNAWKENYHYHVELINLQRNIVRTGNLCYIINCDIISKVCKVEIRSLKHFGMEVLYQLLVWSLTHTNHL